MSAPKTGRPGQAEDWSTRARRFGLSSEERLLFELAQESSATLRMSHQVGCDFDRIAAVRAGDEELIARVANRVLAPSPRASARGVRRYRWALVAAAVLVSSVAAARWSTVRGPAAFVRASAPKATVPPPALPAAPSVLRTAEAVPLAAPTSSGLSPVAVALREPTESMPRGASHTLVSEGAPAPVPPAASDTAADWFRRGNAARRAGDFSSAERLYGELEARFPASDEARLSHVSLGKLLLALGKPTEAERQFSLYTSEGGVELAEEATVGRAQCLERLGRVADERRAWQALRAAFPGSIYAPRARQRLEELSPR